MARSDIVTQLSLDDFAKIVGIHPLHFNQVVHVGAESKTCGIPIHQHSWQKADRTGREEISEALYMAEQSVIKYLGYDIAEVWVEEEKHFSFRNRLDLLHTDKKFVISGGKRAKTLIEAGVSVDFTDGDSDTYEETATIVVSVPADTVGSELEIYYPGKAGDDSWRIETVSKVVSGGVATIVTRRERLVLENLMEILDPMVVEGHMEANFLDEVDVYRVYNDPSVQAEFVVTGCCQTGCVACTFSVQTGCISVLNSASGFVRITPANWVDGAYVGAICIPGWVDRIKLWYKAGKRSHFIDQAVSLLALTFLERPICECSNIEHVVRWWTNDMALSVAGRDRSERVQLSKGILDNPFGTTRAGIRAWRIISNGY